MRLAIQHGVLIMMLIYRAALSAGWLVLIIHMLNQNYIES